MKNKKSGFGLLLAATVSLEAASHSAPNLPKVMTVPEGVAAFGWDFESAEVTTQDLGQGLHVLFGIGGNIVVSLGEDGTFIVDDQFEGMIPKVVKTIGDLGGSNVDFAVTTHWHFDHAEGNLALGPQGTWLVAHENSREMMKDKHVVNMVGLAVLQDAYPESAWPDITYDSEMRFHLNGQTVELMHFGPAHTTGDTAVFFREANILHMGDVFNNTGYPFIDADNGGTLDGLITFCESVLAVINDKTVVVPGHGATATKADFMQYTQDLAVIRDRIAAQVKAGMDLNDIIAEQPSKEFDARYGDNTMFINRAVKSLTYRYHP
jgi:cyclase